MRYNETMLHKESAIFNSSNTHEFIIGFSYKQNKTGQSFVKVHSNGLFELLFL
jgi:hypothetical protein